MTNYQIATFKDNDFTLDVRVDIINKTIWLSMKEICDLYQKNKSTISRHINNLKRQNPSNVEGMVAKYATVLSTRNRLYDQALYNLDLIKEIGVLVKSNRGILLEKFLCDYLNKTEENKDETIIIYNNGEVTLDVTVSPKEETVWLNQNQIAYLFDSTRANISTHIGNIVNEKELEISSVCKKSLHTGTDGKTYSVIFYNLDMILAIGYRVKGSRAIEFRRWATHVLKKYLLQGYAIDEQRVISVRNIVRLENDVEELKVKVNDIEKKMFVEPVKDRLFYAGEFFDAYEFVCSLVMKAKKELIIIDPYFDVVGLSVLEKCLPGVKRIIVISTYAKLNQTDIDKFVSQYGNIQIICNDSFHDRFLIIDKKECYVIGSSINYLGNKVFSAYKHEDSITKAILNILNL